MVGFMKGRRTRRKFLLNHSIVIQTLTVKRNDLKLT